MEADFAVELGRADAALEIPWSGEGVRYYDLKRHPELIDQIEEACTYPELLAFLKSINSWLSPIESAKCDAWPSTEMAPDEDIFHASCKFGSYVDVLFSDSRHRFSFPEHERFAQAVVKLLRTVPEIPARAEFIVRRCYYHEGGISDSRAGFYVTSYIFGFGDNAPQARRQWGIALQIVENALRQLFSTVRR